MDRIDKQELIHDLACFKRDELERRLAEHKFTQLLKVEAFAWDLELYGQLQRQFGERVILKGGAAAQLYFPIHLQRNSVDIDIITDLSEEDFEAGLQAVTQRLCPDGAVCKFQRYIPKQPKNGLHMIRYNVSVPSVCKVDEASDALLILDVLFEKVPSSATVIKETRTFALDLNFAPRVLTANALFGDKLLTLAATTVGIPEERANDRCKQLYDLHHLASLNLLTNFAEIQDSSKFCMEIQNQIPGQENVSLADAVIDVETFLNQARLLDFHDPLRLYQALKSFQSNFVGVDARLSGEAWGIAIETIRLIVSSCLAQQKNPSIDPLEILSCARAHEQIIEGGPFDDGDPESKPRHRTKARDLLLQFGASMKVKTSTVRGRSPMRIYWYLVTPDNIRQLGDLLHNLNPTIITKTNGI
jgi:hypothetical protein